MKTFERNVILFLVTGAGVGYFPRAPGTIGTLLAIPLSVGVNHVASVSFPFALLTLAGFVICAISLSTKGAEILGRKDPEVIVIDEIAGFLVANFLSPTRMVPLALSFLFFRFFDVAKVFPISKLEKLSGGSGIVLDDVMAGIYTFVILRLLFLWGFV